MSMGMLMIAPLDHSSLLAHYHGSLNFTSIFVQLLHTFFGS